MPDISRGEGDQLKPGERLRPEQRVEAGAQPPGELYGFASPPEPSAGADAGAKSAGAGTTDWYAARPGGQPQGPFDRAELRRRVSSGDLRESDLVWREGMPNWVPARDVRELFGTAAEGPPPIPDRAAPAGTGAPAFEPEKLLRGLDAVFSRPVVYRMVGRVCAVFGLLALLLSGPLFFVGIRLFTVGLVFGAVFLIGEAAGAILDHLQRGGKSGGERDGTMR